MDKGTYYRWILALIYDTSLCETDGIPRTHIRYLDLAASNFTEVNSVARLWVYTGMSALPVLIRPSSPANRHVSPAAESSPGRAIAGRCPSGRLHSNRHANGRGDQYVSADKIAQRLPSSHNYKSLGNTADRANRLGERPRSILRARIQLISFPSYWFSYAALRLMRVILVLDAE